MSTHKHLILGILCLANTLFVYTNTLFAQHKGSTHTSSPAVLVYDAPLSLFSVNTSSVNPAKAYVTDATFLTLDRSQLKQLVQDRPQQLTFNLPTKSGKILELSLKQHELLMEDFKLSTSVKERVAYKPGLYYRGHLSELKESLVAISIFEDMVMGIISFDGHNYVLGHLNQTVFPAGDDYILYDEAALTISSDFDCHSDELPSFGGDLSIEDVTKGPETAALGACKVIPVYFECDYKMYQDRGSKTDNVMNYLTGLFNAVTTIYQNEGISVKISNVKVWTTADPYPYSSSSSALNAFRSRLNGSFDGTLAHLLSTRSVGNGGIAYVDVLCSPAYAVAYSNINNSYNNFPTYSWTVNVVAHEMGHNVGSPHTHSCSWPGGALDNCFTPEGLCNRGPAPSNGGTIMSYCHLTNAGVNMNNGFGQYPGNLIRNRVAAANCLPAVEGNCGGGGGGAGSANLTKETDNLHVDGSVYRVTVRVKNIGIGGSTACRIGYYLSRDNNFSVSNDRLIGTKDVSPLNAGAITPNIVFEFNSNTLRDIEQGRYYIGYIIDYLDEVIEANETDNTWYWPSPQIEITNNPTNYCSSRGQDVTYEWIAEVRIGSINNVTERNGGYGDFTNLSTDLPIGGTIQGYLKPGHSSQPYAEQWRIWIDLNRDGDFNDANELVFSNPVATTNPLNTSFSIPGSATPGPTRMRISMKWLEEDNILQGPCSSFGFGEVEDYTVNLVGGGGGGGNNCFLTGVSLAERSDCNATSNTYTQRLKVNYTGSPNVIKVTIGSQNFTFAATGSPQTIELTGLPATGNAVNVTMSISSETGCSDSNTFNNLFIAARPCEPDDCETPLPLGTEEISGNKVRVNWEAVPGARFYQIRYRMSGDTEWTTKNVENGTSVDLENIGVSTSYDYQLRAECNTVGWSDWSAVYVFITTGGCAIPQPYGVDIVSSTEVRLTWYPIPTASKYRIRYRVVGTTAWTGDVEVTGVTYLDLNNLLTGKGYEYQLRARCESGWSGWSVVYMFSTTAGLIGPANGRISSESVALQLGPNPGVDYINIAVSDNTMQFLVISNMNGQPLQQVYVSDATMELNISHLPQGMYILDVILADNQRITKRFVKAAF